MIKHVLKKMIEGETLSEKEAENVMNSMMNGQIEESQIASLLTIMRMRGETVDELTGFTKAMRSHARTVHVSDETLLDTCGTGGDGQSTFNISTAAAIGLSACGVAVAKHGNRSVSSKSGSADVLEALHLPVINEPEQVNETIQQHGLAFLFAPLYHTAMKHVAKTRNSLGFRTIFNLLGPLTNPANAAYQVIGVFDRSYGEQMAEVLKRLGTKRALFVTGEDGIDEITITGTTYVTELNEGDITTYTIHPEMFGLSVSPLSDIQANSIEESAQTIESIFYDSSTTGARDVVVLNMAAGLYVTGQAQDLVEAVAIAKEKFADGTITHHFEQLAKKAGNIHA